LPLAIGLGQAIHYLGAARWLGIYVPRQVSQHLLQGDEFANARPQRREVTIMLTDIVGFTTLAEHNTPEAVTDFVNRHFTMLTRCVEAEGGVVGQFTGDSVMAFWGAPDPQPDHAVRACRTALAIAGALEADNGRRRTRNELAIRMRIGINSGEVTAGSVGAPGRSNYGIVGDAVNATQRIEQLAKTICHDRPTAALLVSGRTRAQAGEGFTFVDMGAHTLRGRQEVMRIHRLVPMRVVSATMPHREPSADEPVSAAGGS
jgi:class 3 adenylate cyclase